MDTTKQQQAMEEAEAVVKSYSPNAQASNKTVRGIKIGLSAAHVATGIFSQYASAKDLERAAKFFAAYEEGGMDAVGRAFAYEH